jgi:hypothetical protein
MTQLFISYSRKDIAFARRLAGDLEKAGYVVWWDITDLRGGDDWVRVIPEAIGTSDFFIVVLSPDSTVSEWVRKEYTQALSLHKRIIPIMLRTTAVPFALNTINYLDFTTEATYIDGLKALLLALGYSGDLPVAAAATWPLTLRSLAIPIIVSAVILLALGGFYVFSPPAASTPTPTVPPTLTSTPTALPSLTPTSTPEPSLTPSATLTLTVTSTVTETFTPRPTLTPSATRTPTFQKLTYCVNSLYANTINVRSGPGTIYARMGDPLLVGTCLSFRGQNEAGTWLLIAPDQTDPALRQYEGGWIFRELLGLGSEGPIDLPAVTLTPTPTPSETPTITPTFTPSQTPTLTPTETSAPAETETPTP